jgi:hypothetical protein
VKPTDGDYRETQRSAVLDKGPAGLASPIDRP